MQRLRDTKMRPSLSVGRNLFCNVKTRVCETFYFYLACEAAAKSLASAPESTLVHFRQRNAPYGNRGCPHPPKKCAFSSSDEYIRHCYTCQGSRVLVQIVQMRHIRDRKGGRPGLEMKTFLVDNCILLHVHCKLFRVILILYVLILQLTT